MFQARQPIQEGAAAGNDQSIVVDGRVFEQDLSAAIFHARSRSAVIVHAHPIEKAFQRNLEIARFPQPRRNPDGAGVIDEHRARRNQVDFDLGLFTPEFAHGGQCAESCADDCDTSHLAPWLIIYEKILTLLACGSHMARVRRAESGLHLLRISYTNTIKSIATFRAPDGFACKARWRRHSCSTSSHLNAAGGFVRGPRRACLSARVGGVVVARCSLSYRLRADALPHAPRDKLNEAILLIVLVIQAVYRTE